MRNSSSLLYSNILILSQYLKSKSNNFDMSKLSVELNIDNAAKRIQDICKAMYNEVESGVYSRYDLIMYYLYNTMLNPKFYITQINRKHIEIQSKLISKKQLILDIQTVEEYLKLLNLKDYESFFKLDEDVGFNIAYKITKSKTISPSFYLEYYKKYKYNKDSKLVDFVRFEKIINLMFDVLKTKRKGAL